MTMVRPHILLAIAALFGLTINPLPSLAQQRTQPFNPSSITSHPGVEQMLQNSKDQPQTMVALKGYVGPSGSPDVVRLYWDLTLTRYFDIPRNAIALQINGQGPNDPVSLMVRASTPIATANNMSADAAAAQRAVIDILLAGGGSSSGGGSGPSGGSAFKLTNGANTFCNVAAATCFGISGAGCVIAWGCLAGSQAR